MYKIDDNKKVFTLKKGSGTLPNPLTGGPMTGGI